MDEIYTCACGAQFESTDELKEHNLEAHGDEMSAEVDKIDPSPPSSSDK